MSQLNPESGLERALRELQPAPSTLDRDRLMFRAGQIAGPTRSRLWPVTTVLAVMVLIQTVLLVARVGVEVRTEIVQVPAPTMEPVRPGMAVPAAKPQQGVPAQAKVPEAAIEEPATEGSEFAYARLYERVLRSGVEELPAPAADPGPAPQLPSITLDRGVAPDARAPRKGNTWNLYRFFQ